MARQVRPLIRVLPQLGPPPHIHHREDGFYYVLEGEFEILDGDRTFAASTGSFVHIPKGTVHCFKNVGEEPGKLLALFTPAGMEHFLRSAPGFRPRLFLWLLLGPRL